MSESNYAALIGLARVGANVLEDVKLWHNISFAMQTWAKADWRERFNAWLQDDSHIPKIVKWPDVIEYRVGKFSVTPRTLCQMVIN